MANYMDNAMVGRLPDDAPPTGPSMVGGVVVGGDQ